MQVIRRESAARAAAGGRFRAFRSWRLAVLLLCCAAIAAAIALGAAWWLDRRGGRSASPLFNAPVAVQAAQDMAARHPRDREWQDRLAIAYVREGHYLSAVEVLERTIALGGPQKDARRALVHCLNRLEYFHEALPHLGKLIELQPDSLDLRLQLAEQYRLMGDLPQAEKVLDDLPRDASGYPLYKDSDGPTTAMERVAARYGLLGAWGKCLRLARQILADTPGHWGAHVILGKGLLVLGRAEEAVPHLRRGMRASPGDPDLEYLLASALQQRGRRTDRSEVKKLLLAVLGKTRTHGRAWYEIGLICRRERNWERAVQSFQNAYDLGVDRRASLRYMGEALEHVGNREESLYRTGLYYEATAKPAMALDCYRRLSEMHGACVSGSIHMARAYGLMGQPRKALAPLLRARKIGGPQPRLLTELATVYSQLKDRENQRKTWQLFIQRDSKDADLGYQQLGVLADSMGNLGEAEGYYRKCMELQPTSENYKMQLAQLLLDRRNDPRRVEEAVRLLEDAVRLARQSSQIHFLLGLAYSHAGRKEEALWALRHAVDLEPGDGRPYFPMSQVLQAAGRRKDAEECRVIYKRYLDFLAAQEVLAARSRRAPRDVEARLRLASLYERAGAVENAIMEYERLAKLQPGEPGHYRRLVRLYGEIARYEDQARTQALVTRLERQGNRLTSRSGNASILSLH